MSRVTFRIDVPSEFLTLDAQKLVFNAESRPYLACGAICPDKSGDLCGEFIGHRGKHVSTSSKEWRNKRAAAPAPEEAQADE